MTPIYRVSAIAKKALSLLLALVMLSGEVAAAEELTESQSARVYAAPLSTDGTAKNGMVRVYLSSLGSPTTLNLTINGSYSVNGNTSRSLSNGASVTVGFSSSTGAITLSYGGEKTNMGTSFALRRHSAAGDNGIRISQAKEPGNAYPGDISFKAIKSGGVYKLYTIAHVYIENYLYGVLPYEMGNSTNIEALKAQAVAARTYTVRMMNARSGSTYDVVDTTSDQVYRGTPSGNANCVSAVDQTKGIVLMYGSSCAMTYYSASNGGQTESAKNLWGSTGYDYLTVKDDPFDYGNPSSTVKSKTVYKDLTSGLNSSALISLLKSKAVTALSRAGYSASSGNTTLTALAGVTPHTPKYSSPSRLYTKMDFTLSANVNGASASCTVTCDIFGELEGALSMSIQSSSNELWSVKSSSSSFTLQARRYGHGIGMSQRGAMYMAKLGYTYDEILGFYYEGCKRVRNSFTNTILSVSGSTETTIEDAVEEDDGEDSCKGTVKLVSSGSSIAIRAGKSTSAAILGTAGNGAIMSVSANDGQWCFVKYGEICGYLPSNALSITGAPSGGEGAVTSVAGFAAVTANDYVNLRSSGSMQAGIVSTAPSGAVMTVFSQSGSWARVQYCATVAYVNTNYVRITSSYPSATMSTGSATAIVIAQGGADMLASPSTSAQTVTHLAAGASLTVASDDGSWTLANYGGVSGYVLTSAISYDGESLDNVTDSDAAAGDGSGSTGDTGSTDSAGNTGNTGNTGDASTPDGGANGSIDNAATVSIDVAYLREQPNANSSSIMIIAYGQAVTVITRGVEWCQINCVGVEGYILTSSLSIAGTGAVVDSGATAVGTATVNTQSGSLNLRAEARAGSAVLTTIPRFAQVKLTSIGELWCGVSYNGVNGYCMTSFLTIDGQAGESLPTPDIGDGKTATVLTLSGSLNLRAQPRAGSEILTTIPRLATVSISSYGAEWCGVTYMGTSGYAMTAFLSFSSSGEGTGGDASAEPTDTPGSTTTPDDSTNSDINDPDEPLVPDETNASTLYAVVSTVSGSLNLRRDAMPGSDVLARIPKGATIIIDERLSAWSRTTYAGQTGYVINSYLAFHQGQQASDNAQRAIVNTLSGSLNLRTEPSADAGVLMRIPQYAEVEVDKRGTSWCYIRFGTSMGYVMTSFLMFDESTGVNDGGSGTGTTGNSGDTGTTDSESGAGTANSNGEQSGGAQASNPSIAYVQTNSGSLNLRASPSGGSRVLTTIPRNTTINVTSYGADWCGVEYDAYTGYVVTSYLRFETAPAAAESNSGSDNANSDGNSASSGGDSANNGSGVSSGSDSASGSGDSANTGSSVSSGGADSNAGGNGSDGGNGASDANANGGATGDSTAASGGATTSDQPTGEISNDSSTSNPVDPTDAWVNTPSGSLNLRSKPLSDARVLITIPRHTKVQKYVETGEWSYIAYKGEYGYVSTSFLSDSDPTVLVDSTIGGWQGEGAASATGEYALDITLHAPDTLIYALASPLDDAATLKLYSQCSEQSAMVAELARGEQIELVLVGDTWCLVQYLTYQGYCLTEVLEVISQ